MGLLGVLGLALALPPGMALAPGGPPPPRKAPGEIAPYPPMQWHSWGLFTHEDLVTEANMLEMAEALVSSGMAAAGYDTVNVVCNGWAGRDPKTGAFVENRTLWPSGMTGFASRLHAMDPPLKVGCYTATVGPTNCMCGPAPQGGCEEGTGPGYEAIDMEFFASVGCDHVMVDGLTNRETAAKLGSAIANSSNPNMLFGVWSGSGGHAWKWAGAVGGTYWRIGTDSYDSWQSVLRQWDTVYSIPSIESFTRPGRYSFLDQMIIGDVPGHKGSAYGPGLTYDEAVAHMSMFVMAATPLLICTDVRNMSNDIKNILTNPEVLAIHKDPLARMATRIDVGGTHELHVSNLCSADFPACQEGPTDPGTKYPCKECRSNWTVWEKPLHDNSSAVMVLNRGTMAFNVSIDVTDLADSTQGTWSARDLWTHSDLGVVSSALVVNVPAHGVRMLRMRPHVPAPIPQPSPSGPPPPCPAGYDSHAPGLWSNCKLGVSSTCIDDKAIVTTAACAEKCNATKGCLAFEVYQVSGQKSCYMFIHELKLPFIPDKDCFACVKHGGAPTSSPLSGFKLGNGTFLLNGAPIRLFAGALQHFRIHPDSWPHRLRLAKAMGLNAVQTLIPWMMMEPAPDAFETTGFLDIVRFSQMAQAEGLLIVLRAGPFICDGPDYGGFPWWLTQQNTAATEDPAAPGSLLRVRTADPAFLRRVDLFYSKLFAVLRLKKLTADLGGPIIMVQVDNEYGLFGTDQAYLQHIRNSWRAGLGDGVVLHSTDPASPAVLAASRTPGVLQTVDFPTQGNVAASFATLKASQKLSSKVEQPLMVSEFYPGYITSDGEKQFPIIYDPAMVASQLDKVLNTTYCGGSTSFALWLFAACSDFGFWGGTLWGYHSKSLGVLTPSYDVGAPVDESGGIRPLFHMLQAVLKRHGANTSSVLPPSPPVAAFGKVVMTKRLPLWRALQALAPHPVRSGTVRTMEELQQGYGYIHYSTPVPQFEAASAGSLVLSGMRDRALVYFDRKLYQTCTRGNTVDAVVCSAAAAVPRVEQLDILVENQGRVTGGVIGTELPWRGIRQYVTLDGRILANWSITPLPLNNTQALAPLWSSGDADQVDGPAFFRAEFTIAPGKLADTFLTLPGWQKGQAFINDHNLARYVSTGPQFSFYCPAGFLRVGTNELILFETGGAPSNRTVEFTAMQTVVGPKSAPAPAPQPSPSGPPPPCPAGYDSHAPGLWSNCKLGVSSTCIDDKAIVTTAACAEKCNATKGCLAFEVYQVSGQKSCYMFIHELKLPFIPDKDCFACVKHGGAPTPLPPSPPAPPSPKPPPPPPPPPQRGSTTGHSFPRLGNCWGADPFITPKMWNYLGFPNMTNASWGRYDVQYINPFDSCCWKMEMDSWTPMIRAIKKENPQAVVLATFHATEIWEVDLQHKGGWLPDKCLVRNTNGELCSWWAGLVFTNNLFDPDCMRAALDNAFAALPELVAAGVDGVFLDGVVDFDIGCSPATPCNGNCHPTADINCTHANCTHTPQQPWPVLAKKFTALYVHWFEQLKKEYGDKFVWVNNLAQDQTPFIPVSNGRMYEGGAGLDNCFSGGRSISSFVSEIRMWSTKAVQPSYLNLHMNANMGGGTWRIGRWQNLVTEGEMMRLMTDYRRMRFGLGVALLTDGYFGYDVGSEMYGAPSFFTEYEAELGQAVADPVRILVDGTQEVWSREFEHGFAIVSSLTERNHTVSLPAPVRELPLSAQPGRLSGGREAPAWQFVVENSGGLGSDESFHVAGYHDWWADDAHRASFRTIEGNWTAVNDQTKSHNYGADFLVGFSMPGGPSGTSQGEPGSFSAAWTFESPASGLFSISTTAVDAHMYPLTDGAIVCVRLVGTTTGLATEPTTSPPKEPAKPSEITNSAACIAQATLDQRAGIRDGRWQMMVASVALQKEMSYEVVIAWDPTCNGYVAADAILVESHALYHGGGTAAVSSKEVTVGAMDGRVVLKA